MLELEKCLFHQIHFDFESDGHPLMHAGTYGEPLQVKDPKTSNPGTIPEKLAFDTHKTFGHHKAPAGNNSTQLHILQTKSNGFSQQVATSSCNQTDSWFFYNAIYLKSIGYVLPNCFYEECE